MYPPIARLLSALTLLVDVNQQDQCLSLPPDKLWINPHSAGIILTSRPQDRYRLGSCNKGIHTSKKKRVEPLESPPEVGTPMTQFLTIIRDSHKNGKKWLQATEVGYAGLDLCSVTTSGNN